MSDSTDKLRRLAKEYPEQYKVEWCRQFRRFRRCNRAYRCMRTGCPSSPTNHVIMEAVDGKLQLSTLCEDHYAEFRDAARSAGVEEIPSYSSEPGPA